MSEYEDKIKAITWNYPEYIPITTGVLPAAWMKYRESLDEIVKRHPIIFNQQTERKNYDAIGGTYVAGEHIDAWGCIWSNVKTGMEAIVTKHSIPTREMVNTYKVPDKDIGFPHGFMYLRLADLRGFEELMIDFIEEAPELQKLIDIVCNYNLRQAKIRLLELNTGEDIVYFGDDLGMQNGLAIAPEIWRKYLKPCFAKIYKPFRDAGHQVYMHTDGHILEIIPDLIECGVSVVNPQVRANGLDNLAACCKNKICVALDLDRQLFPFCTPQDIDNHVREVVEKLGSPAGGLWLVAEIGEDVPLPNIEALCTALETYRGYYRN